MPSSSTRTTHLELQLRHTYQTAYVRLHAAHLYRHANSLTTQFALLLDTTEREMQLAQHPELLPGHSAAEAEAWREDMRVSREAERLNGRLRGSEKVAGAADVLVDVAGLLEGKGWGDEVRDRWLGWGEYALLRSCALASLIANSGSCAGRGLWEIAGKMWDDEEYFRRG